MSGGVSRAPADQQGVAEPSQREVDHQHNGADVMLMRDVLKIWIFR